MSRSVLVRLRRVVGRRRRVVAAVLAAAAVAVGVGALRPDAPATVDVAVAAGDLAAGTRLRAVDVDTVALPAGAVPDGAAKRAGLVGQVLAGPVRRGEPFTDVRLVSADTVAGYGEGKVGAPVRIADPGIASLLRPGSVVDVLAVPTAGGLDATGPAKVVAAEVRVVAVPADDTATTTGGTLVVVAASPRQAAALTRSAAGARLSVTLHGR